ncbi:MAG: inorganic diphosphatase [Candidatus Woesearchaeota archaeon]
MQASTDFLGKDVTITIDRKMGSKHPKWDFYYPVNYGYVKGVMSGDGEELDAYVLGVYEPLETFTGMCIAVLQRTKEHDDKLIVVPQGTSYTDDQIRALVEFQERFFESHIIR